MNPLTILSMALVIGAVVYIAWKRMSAYLVLSAVILLIFLFTVLTSSYIPYAITSPVFRELAFRPAYMTTGESLYTLITSMFVHADVLHLIFNLLALIMIGVWFEDKVGAPRFTVLFFITGIIGTFVYTVPNLNSTVFLVGASGAICGLLGAAARLYPRDRMMFFFGFGVLPPMPVMVVAALFVFIETLLAYMRADNVAHFAHIGGLIGGLLIAPLVMRIGLRTPQKRKREMSGYEQLAVTPELKEILEHIKSEDDKDVRAAWLERFLGKVSCPNCGRKLGAVKRKVECPCGWKLDRKL